MSEWRQAHTSSGTCRIRKVLIVRRDPTQRDNFTYLAVALAFLFLAIFVAQGVMPDVHGPVLETITLVVLLIGVQSTRRAEQVFRAGSAMVAVLLAIIGIRFFVDTPALTVAHGLTLVAFLTLTIVASLRQVVLARDVDTNCIVGTVTIYVMIATNWAVLYTLAATLLPGAFNGLSVGSTRATFLDLMYFSIVTLSTVGYGDIQPVHPVARGLAMIEMIVGQFYIAILVATLVGARRTRWEETD